jgi:hypothetical protein
MVNLRVAFGLLFWGIVLCFNAPIGLHENPWHVSAEYARITSTNTSWVMGFYIAESYDEVAKKRVFTDEK